MTKKNALLILVVVPLLTAVGCSAPGVTKTCLPGSVDCGNGCVQLQQDQLNCGTCGNACAAGNVCSAGTCALSCQAGLTSCGGSCSDLQNDEANCGACGNACGAGSFCSAGTCTFAYTPGVVPPQCFLGSDPVTPAVKWTVCAADATTAWVSMASPGGGNYHADWICKSLGYRTVGVFGGTCGKVCGLCGTGTWTCSAHGPQTFDGSGGTCAADAWGQVLCLTVMWTCIK
jgi:hypothetical protein